MPKRNAADGSQAEPNQGGSFRGEFTRLEREYVLARSILAARHATGMSKGAFAKAVGTSKGKLSRWERAEAIPRLEMLQRIANVTGLSFQIGIEPLETPDSSGSKSSRRKSTTRKTSEGKTTPPTSSGRKSSPRGSRGRRSTTAKSGTRKTGAGTSAGTGSTGRKRSVRRASPKSSRAKETARGSAEGASS